MSKGIIIGIIVGILVIGGVLAAILLVEEDSIDVTENNDNNGVPTPETPPPENITIVLRESLTASQP